MKNFLDAFLPPQPGLILLSDGQEVHLEGVINQL
jgi:hypothetical protein